jgi:hypothetical protein
MRSCLHDKLFDSSDLQYAHDINLEEL